jgi:transcriptional regulator with XRE-family HTH domain
MEELSVRIRDKRGSRGIREVAKEIDISPATLSRIESGKQPDIGTFGKLCKWLNIDPSTVLGLPTPSANTANMKNDGLVHAHFRADKELSPDTANHLAQLILAVQKQYQLK